MYEYIFVHCITVNNNKNFFYTGLFTRGVFLNFYFAATNTTMAVTTKNVLFLLN
jgi:hypothetical protein